jgi:hypothetical protein
MVAVVLLGRVSARRGALAPPFSTARAAQKFLQIHDGNSKIPRDPTLGRLQPTGTLLKSEVHEIFLFRFWKPSCALCAPAPCSLNSSWPGTRESGEKVFGL